MARKYGILRRFVLGKWILKLLGRLDMTKGMLRSGMLRGDMGCQGFNRGIPLWHDHRKNSMSNEFSEACLGRSPYLPSFNTFPFLARLSSDWNCKPTKRILIPLFPRKLLLQAWKHWIQSRSFAFRTVYFRHFERQCIIWCKVSRSAGYR